MVDLRSVVAELDRAVKDVRKGTSRLPEITDAVADGVVRIPDLVEETRSSIREMERLIVAMQKHWLIRKHVNKSDPPPIAKPVEVAPPEARAEPDAGPKNDSDQ